MLLFLLLLEFTTSVFILAWVVFLFPSSVLILVWNFVICIFLFFLCLSYILFLGIWLLSGAVLFLGLSSRCPVSFWLVFTISLWSVFVLFIFLEYLFMSAMGIGGGEYFNGYWFELQFYILPLFDISPLVVVFVYLTTSLCSMANLWGGDAITLFMDFFYSSIRR